MKKTFVGIVAATFAVVGLASAAKADLLYIDSNGMSHYLSTDIDVTPMSVTTVSPIVERTLVSPAVIEPMPLQTHIITSPAVVQPVTTTLSDPVVIDRTDRRGLFHFGLWPLIDLNLF